MADDQPGRGKKQCTKCQKYVGVRNSTCPHCSNPFGQKATPSKPVEAKKEVKKAEVKATEVVNTAPKSVHSGDIITPAGRCPVTLDSTSESDVLIWADKVRERFDGRLSNKGLLYFVRHFFGYHTEEHKVVVNILTTALQVNR
jgi:hypothetical protein